MSFDCQRWAADQTLIDKEGRGAPTGRKFVLFMLASHSRQDGSCWMSQPKLAGYTGQSERSVRDHLAKLEDDNYLRRYERRSKRHGHRLADGFLLDPLTIYGIDKYLDDAESMSERETPGREKARNRPVDNSGLPAKVAARPSGDSLEANRQLSPRLPATLAGIDEENPQGRDIEGSPAEDSAGAPCGAATSDEAAPPVAAGEQQGDQAAAAQLPSAHAFWQSQQAALAEFFGAVHGVWIKPLLPLRYDGAKLVLGASTRFIADKINGVGRAGGADEGAPYREQLAGLLGLEVEVIVYNLTVEHTKRRQAELKHTTD
jgi:hypothetical protein